MKAKKMQYGGVKKMQKGGSKLISTVGGTSAINTKLNPKKILETGFNYNTELAKKQKADAAKAATDKAAKAAKADAAKRAAAKVASGKKVKAVVESLIRPKTVIAPRTVVKTPVKTPVDSLGAVTPSEGITNESLVPQEPTKTPSIIPLSAMGAIPQEKTPIKSELSALSMQPEVTQYETLKSQIQDIQSILQDPNVSPEKKQEALRDFQYYAPQIPKVIDGYQNYAYKQISAVASNPTEGGLEKVKPFITALYPDIKNIILKKELIEGTKDQYQNKFLMKFQEGKNEYYIPVDSRSLMTMNDPKQQMDVVNKVENAREETLRAIAISDRQMKQMLSSQDNTIRANAQQLYLFELRAAPTVQRNTDPKTKAVQPLIPLFKTKYDLLVELEDKLLKEKGLEDNSKNRNIVIQDPEYKKLDNSLIDQTRK